MGKIKVDHTKGFTGKKFGELTALRPINTIGKHKKWICECSCGRIVELTNEEKKRNI